MDCRRFWQLVPHLHCYQGAVAAKRHHTPTPTPPLQEIAQMPSAPQSLPQGVPQARPGVRMIGATAAQIGMSELRDLISFGSAHG